MESWGERLGLEKWGFVKTLGVQSLVQGDDSRRLGVRPLGSDWPTFWTFSYGHGELRCEGPRVH